MVDFPAMYWVIFRAIGGATFLRLATSCWRRSFVCGVWRVPFFWDASIYTEIIWYIYICTEDPHVIRFIFCVWIIVANLAATPSFEWVLRTLNWLSIGCMLQGLYLKWSNLNSYHSNSIRLYLYWKICAQCFHQLHIYKWFMNMNLTHRHIYIYIYIYIYVGIYIYHILLHIHTYIFSWNWLCHSLFQRVFHLVHWGTSCFTIRGPLELRPALSLATPTRCLWRCLVEDVQHAVESVKLFVCVCMYIYTYMLNIYLYYIYMYMRVCNGWNFFILRYLHTWYIYVFR